LFVDSHAVPTHLVALELLQAIACRNGEVIQMDSNIEGLELSLSGSPQLTRNATRLAAVLFSE
jgi:hypothetical protein